MRAPLNGIAHMQADQYHCLVFQRGKAVFYLLVKVGHFYPLHVQYDLLVNVFFYFILTEIFRQNRSHEKLIRKFLQPIKITKRQPHTYEKRFMQSEINCQNESVSSQRIQVVACWRLFDLYLQKFVEFVKFTDVYSSSRKFVINHKQWRKVRTGLSLQINPLKITARKSRTKRLEQNPTL